MASGQNRHHYAIFNSRKKEAKNELLYGVFCGKYQQIVFT